MKIRCCNVFIHFQFIIHWEILTIHHISLVDDVEVVQVATECNANASLQSKIGIKGNSKTSEDATVGHKSSLSEFQENISDIKGNQYLNKFTSNQKLFKYYKA